ncbi:S8 family serine peptidase [Dactylosporangium sp. NPDC048998]|uniref:S8 family serine peptidase n=1 Tax=Dactylosporangium sp. NPDC048998 TaxID=3363976 RepID=UPI00372219A1
MILQRYVRLGAAAVLAGGLAVAAAPTAPASAAPECAKPGAAKPAQASWARPALALDSVAALSTGRGQRIAVLSTGVDAQQPQLRGRVEDGVTLVPGTTGPANTDCAGFGTQVAGVIAGAATTDRGFAGVAPGAKIVPIRVTDGRTDVTAALLATGIRAAVTAKVDVICLPLPVYTASDDLDGAVKAALAAGISVVAAAGDAAGQGSNPTPFPASYPGVIAVAAMGPTGDVTPRSGAGDYVSLGAPGAAVVTLQTGSGLVSVDGTGVAAGFVAGSVALVQARRGELSPAATARQLTATATPTQAFAGDKALAGMVNPYRALTETLTGASPAAVPGYQPPTPDQADTARAAARDRALLIAGGALVMAVLLAIVAVAAPRARRRSWRPALARRPVEVTEPAEPSPPVMLFEDHR